MSRSQRSGGYWVRSALVFVMHQIIGTEGVVWLAALGVFLLRSSVREVHEPWGSSALMRGMHLIFSNTPIKRRCTHARTCGNFEKRRPGCRCRCPIEENPSHAHVRERGFCTLLRPLSKTTEVRRPHAHVRRWVAGWTRTPQSSGRDPLGGYSL